MKHASLAKVAVNAAVVALNVVMMRRSLTVANKPRLPITTQLTSVPNALSKQSQQTSQRKVTSRLLAKKTAKNAHPANAAAVTVMVASAVNVVTVPSRHQSKLLTPAPRPLRQCNSSTPRPAQTPLSWSAR